MITTKTNFLFLIFIYLISITMLYGQANKQNIFTHTTHVGNPTNGKLLSLLNTDLTLINIVGRDKSKWGDFRLLNYDAQNPSVDCFNKITKEPLYFKTTALEYNLPPELINKCQFDIIWNFKVSTNTTPLRAYKTINALNNIQGTPGSVKISPISFGNLNINTDRLVAEITLSSSALTGWDRLISLHYEDGAKNQIELARLITPFSSKGVIYKIYADISKYISQLNSPNSEIKNIITKIDDITSDYTYSLNFYVIKRARPLKMVPVEVQKIYENSYLTLEQIQTQNFGALNPITNASSYKKINVLMRITGHAHAEQSIGTIHSLKIASSANPTLYFANNFKIDTVWSDNNLDDSDDEINNRQKQGVQFQGGTISVIRQGWIPGRRVLEKLFEIPANVKSDPTLNISYNIPTYGTSDLTRTGTPIYNISIHAFKYN